MNALPVYNDSYIKIKIRTYGDKVFTNFRCLNVPEDGIECKLFTAISIDSLLASIFRISTIVILVQLCLSNWRQSNDKLSW